MRFLYPGFPAGRIAVGLLAVRLVVGAALILHGWPKIKNPFGWMDGMGPSPPPGLLQAAAAVAEFGGGIAWILGALTPLFSFLLVCNMTTAAFMVHVPHGDPFVAMNRPGAPYVASSELAFVYLAVAVLLLLAGPGALSVDALLFGGKSRTNENSP